MNDPTTAPSPLRRARRVLPDTLRRAPVMALLRLTVAEDIGAEGDWRPDDMPPAHHDVTSRATLDPAATLEGTLVAKEGGVVAGLPVAEALCRLVDAELAFTPRVEEGERVEKGTPIASVSGPGPALLTAERPALNFVGRLSGIATLTRRYVDAVAHTEADILDTRKTLPGHRHTDKYAVRQGGARNHRMGLYDMVLIKDNHIDAAGGIAEAVSRARETHGDDYPIEVEVSTLDELDAVLPLTPDFILLDNMTPATLREAAVRTNGRVPLEASGGVTLETVRPVAETGVDAISVGALTHSAETLDVSLRAG